LLFLDGSPHAWLGAHHPPVCLLLSSDDATGKALWGKFQPRENRDGCFEVCYRTFSRYGLPGGFYLDRASHFITTRHGGLHAPQRPEQDETHFQRAMRELAIGLTFAHSPQARGRGERLNGTFQGRLVAELGVHGVQDCREATRYLNERFIPRAEKWFARAPADPDPAWRPVPEPADLRAVLCAQYTRSVTGDNTIGFQGRRWQLLPPAKAPHLVRARVQVQQRFDGTVHFMHPRYGRLRAELIEDPAT
jgi:hypothetical protein